MHSVVRTVLTIILHLFLLIYIIADCFFRESAFEDSNKFASSAQKELNGKFFEYFFIIFCDILLPPVVAVLLIIYYVLIKGKVHAIAFLIYFCLTAYLISILKMIYHDPRPYWVTKTVENFECYTEFGNPSGHSLAAVVVFGMFWHKHIWSWVERGQVKALNYWQKEQVQMNENLIKDRPENEQAQGEELSSSRSCRFFLFTILTLLVVFFILFGRIYLGMHSYNEVFLGFVYGFYCNYMYLMYIEDIMVALIHATILKNEHDITENFQFISWLLFGILTAFFLIFLLVPIIAFEASKSSVFIPQIWYLSIRAACPSKTTIDMFYYKCFRDCGVIGLPFGILIGILFTKGKHMIGLEEMNEQPCKSSKQTIILRNLGRVIIVVLISGGTAGIFNAIPKNDDVYFSYFVNNTIGTFLAGFLLVKLVPFVLYKVKLDQEDDFLKYQGGEIIIKSKNDQEMSEVKKEGDLENTNS